MSKQLNEPIIESGIRNTYFFNGRLLTADDLKNDQKAGRDQRGQLGRAIGDGIIEGLEISLISAGTTSTAPIVGVTKGLALNRNGQILSLPNDDQVMLVRKTEPVPPEAGIFADCEQPMPTFTNLADGAYLLLVGPASGFQEKAPMRSVEPGNVAGCGSKYAVEGVQFRFVKLDLSITGISEATRTQLTSLLDLTDAASVSKRRNILAHLCFDIEEVSGQRRDPFKHLDGDAGYVNYGALATLRTLGQITSCEVPLALVYWRRQGIQFVDNWAVRRLARRVMELDVLSILRSYGYERLLQFQSQLQDLFDRLGGLAAVRLQDYFQYLPPVGYYAVTGPKSPRGFHSTAFLSQYTIGAASRITAERFGALMRESFSCPDVNLQTKPVFQVFRVQDNESAVNADTSTQLYQVFVSRALNGALRRDGVAKAFSDAWEVYRGLIKRRTFLPLGTDAEKIAAQSAITGAGRDVLDVANRQSAIAATGALDTSAALDAFLEMHRVQNELATLFQSNIPGIADTQDREVFGRRVAELLNTTTSGRLALAPAIAARDLPATVDAQNAINQFVGTWSGEGVALGPFGATLQESPQGLNLVRGRTEPFPHRFLVVNGTDKRLTIDLEASLTGPGAAWTGEAKIKDMSNVEISNVNLARGASTSIIVEVKAPGTATIGDVATLTLSTAVGPPTGRTHQSTLNLTVAQNAGDAVSSRVIFDGTATQPAGTPDDAGTNQNFNYGFNVRYSAAPGVTAPAHFRFRVELTTEPTLNDLTSGWRVRIQGQPLDNRGAGVFTRDLDLTPSQTTMVQLTIFSPRARASAAQTAAFTVAIESVGLSPADISQDYPETSRPEIFRLRLRS